MKRLSIACVILLMLTSQSTFAQKPPVSDPVISIADLKLIIESNELGKKAQAKVILLEEKVRVLDTVVTGQKLRILSKDSTIADQKIQVSKLQEVHSNDLTIQGNYAIQIHILQADLATAAKRERRAKRNTIFVGIAGGLISGYLGYKYITK